MRVEYHPSTVSDLNQAVMYYESQRRGLGNELRQEIYRTIDRIVSSPARYPVVKESIRRCFVKAFSILHLSTAF